jgi:hypothetical protein
VLIILPAAGLLSPARGARHSLTPLFVIESAVFGVLSVLLLAAPDVIASGWPWALPPVLGQLYACFFLTFAVGAAMATRETEPRAIVTFTLASFVLLVLVLVASLLHVDRFKPEPITTVWFAAFSLGAVVFGLALGWSSGAIAWLRRASPEAVH